MWEQDERVRWEDHIAGRCNDALLRLREEDEEYNDFIRHRVQLSERVAPFIDAEDRIDMQIEMQAALREYIEALLEGQNMDEMIACYKRGFGDALNIVIETGALPNQR